MKGWASWLVCALLVSCVAPRVTEAPRDVQHERWLAALAAPLTAPHEADQEWERYEREHESSPVSDGASHAAALRCAERGSGRARVWALEHVGSLGLTSGVEDLRRRLFEQLLERYVDEPYMSTFAQEPESRFNIPGYAPSWECMLSQIAERTQVAETAAALHFALACAYDRFLPEALEMPDPADACLRHLRAALSGPLSEDSERIARGMLFAREHLLEGQLLPNVQAVDTDGVSFELADYRGRVTLIVFWGFWCRPCRAELPLLARLAKRFEDRAFTLLGVATDDDLEFWRAEAARSGVSWRNAWVGTTRDGWPVRWGGDWIPATAAGWRRRTNRAQLLLVENVERLHRRGFAALHRTRTHIRHRCSARPRSTTLSALRRRVPCSEVASALT